MLHRSTGAAVLALLLSPGAAAAGTVGGEVGANGFGDFTYRAAKGEENRVLVTEKVGSGVVVKDRGAPVVARGDCMQLGRHRARCPRAQGKIVVRVGDGDDAVRFRGFAAAADFVRFVEAYGGKGSDRMIGSAGPDYLSGRGGDDHIRGRGDGDSLSGDRGGDLIKGGPGSDTIDGNRGADHIQGRGEADFIRGGRGKDLLKGGHGADDVKGGRGDDELQGRADADVLRGGPDDDVVKGGHGDDLLDGRGGDDQLRGRTGDDVLRGGAGIDLLRGGTGDDVLDGRLYAEDLSLLLEPDRVRGGTGTDTALPDTSDTISGAERVSVWLSGPLDLDHRLHVLAEPTLDGESATFVASCDAAEGCSGTLVLEEDDGGELGRESFDLPAGDEDDLHEIRVDLTPAGAERLREGTHAVVHIRADARHDDVHPSGWGYRMFLRGG